MITDLSLTDHSSQTVSFVAHETVPRTSRAEHHEKHCGGFQAAGGAKPPESVLASIFHK